MNIVDNKEPPEIKYLTFQSAYKLYFSAGSSIGMYSYLLGLSCLILLPEQKWLYLISILGCAFELIKSFRLSKLWPSYLALKEENLKFNTDNEWFKNKYWIDDFEPGKYLRLFCTKRLFFPAVLLLFFVGMYSSVKIAAITGIVIFNTIYALIFYKVTKTKYVFSPIWLMPSAHFEHEKTYFLFLFFIHVGGFFISNIIFFAIFFS